MFFFFSKLFSDIHNFSLHILPNSSLSQFVTIQNITEDFLTKMAAPVLKTGATFVLGAMVGALLTRGLHHSHHHHHEIRRRWSCPRQSRENKSGPTPEGNESAPPPPPPPTIAANHNVSVSPM
ncbi:hypothetical protein TorRG33x02_280650 [Trema orientale]|uniref:Uncharacterized protein n=1 Tax=Trema orientale TaxID=63057 RepID=A0A2P5CLH3_TREOI|nr:hypothetical protein TorRG33x02_280650 [Trema orientale]